MVGLFKDKKLSYWTAIIRVIKDTTGYELPNDLETCPPNNLKESYNIEFIVNVVQAASVLRLNWKDKKTPTINDSLENMQKVQKWRSYLIISEWEKETRNRKLDYIGSFLEYTDNIQACSVFSAVDHICSLYIFISLIWTRNKTRISTWTFRSRSDERLIPICLCL